MLPRHERNAAKFSGQSMPATYLDAMDLRQPSLWVATCLVAVGPHWVDCGPPESIVWAARRIEHSVQLSLPAMAGVGIQSRLSA